MPKSRKTDAIRSVVLSTDKMEQLIELAREEPCLYDVTLAGHSDQQLINNTWEQNAKKLEVEGSRFLFFAQRIFTEFWENPSVHTMKLEGIPVLDKSLWDQATRVVKHMECQLHTIAGSVCKIRLDTWNGGLTHS